jgi:hypothetical protein
MAPDIGHEVIGIVKILHTYQHQRFDLTMIRSFDNYRHMPDAFINAFLLNRRSRPNIIVFTFDIS